MGKKICYVLKNLDNKKKKKVKDLPFAGAIANSHLHFFQAPAHTYNTKLH